MEIQPFGALGILVCALKTKFVIFLANNPLAYSRWIVLICIFNFIITYCANVVSLLIATIYKIADK